MHHNGLRGMRTTPRGSTPPETQEITAREFAVCSLQLFILRRGCARDREDGNQQFAVALSLLCSFTEFSLMILALKACTWETRHSIDHSFNDEPERFRMKSFTFTTLKILTSR